MPRAKKVTSWELINVPSTMQFPHRTLYYGAQFIETNRIFPRIAVPVNKDRSAVLCIIGCRIYPVWSLASKWISRPIWPADRVQAGLASPDTGGDSLARWSPESELTDSFRSRTCVTAWNIFARVYRYEPVAFAWVCVPVSTGVRSSRPPCAIRDHRAPLCVQTTLVSPL